MASTGKHCLYGLMILCCPVLLPASALFDGHLHYNADHAEVYSPLQIVQLLENNGIRQALVTSRPAPLALQLHAQDSKRILPLLGAYRSPGDKENWFMDAGLPERIEAMLEKGPWRGIGELHLFARDRHSPVFQQVVVLARQHRLPLLLHTDPAVIDSVYELAPQLTVIWAHAGTFPYPDLIADYLQRYPALYIDLSVRDQRIAPGGRIHDDWYELFLRYPERFLIGVDTYSLNRWQEYPKRSAYIRHWLGQLPESVAVKLAYENGLAVFGKTTPP